ncbi:4'-phosphopantetheinyl transferase [Flavobacterium sp. 90]|uniref:4'-phosphopantetheinyl transferase family protein n=1 Tax=unclassified Flavobacterium TaxID=196869 RepID=UPI000EAEB40B|nr:MULTISPECIES: 4'-phosphopantetheinyl transferase superfamily protein [unclassified Flavobacterium]RKR04555.1 4'-phosphopantetheinyl transferase [Flavobacterium sp. 81]TCK55884.1 4'-phosphopantetheinyl transferase [Flavobacterium sp. 90]
MTQILYSYICERNHNYLLTNYLDGFSDDFQKKILAYRRWQDSQLSLLGRLLLRHGLHQTSKNFVEEDLSYTLYRKPFLNNTNTKFNISHSGEIVVCVLSDRNDVGIDIEIIQDINIEGFESQMTNRERENLSLNEDSRSAFFDYWTQKEAVIKANGKGLSIPLKSFEVMNNYAKIEDDDFFVKEIFLDEKYKCHLAFKDKIDVMIVGPDRIMIHEL